MFYLDKVKFDKFLKDQRERVYSEKHLYLKTIPIMRLLTYSQLKQITEKFRPISKIRFSYLFQQGDPANYLYIVKSGELRVSY